MTSRGPDRRGAYLRLAARLGWLSRYYLTDVAFREAEATLTEEQVNFDLLSHLRSRSEGTSFVVLTAGAKVPDGIRHGLPVPLQWVTGPSNVPRLLESGVETVKEALKKELKQGPLKERIDRLGLRTIDGLDGWAREDFPIKFTGWESAHAVMAASLISAGLGVAYRPELTASAQIDRARRFAIVDNIDMKIEAAKHCGIEAVYVVDGQTYCEGHGALVRTLSIEDQMRASLKDLLRQNLVEPDASASNEERFRFHDTLRFIAPKDATDWYANHVLDAVATRAFAQGCKSSEAIHRLSLASRRGLICIDTEKFLLNVLTVSMFEPSKVIVLMESLDGTDAGLVKWIRETRQEFEHEIDASGHIRGRLLGGRRLEFEILDTSKSGGVQT